MEVLQVICLFLLPYIFNKIPNKWTVSGMLSPVVLCYVFGILLGNLFPQSFDHSILKIVSSATLLLAIPLLLLSCNIFAWFKYAKSSALSFVLAVLSILISSIVSAYLFSAWTDEIPEMAAMLVGVYTGGTPNMAAISFALDANENTFIALYLADTLICGVYLIFLTSIAQKVFSFILPSFKQSETRDNNEMESINFEKEAGPIDYLKAMGIGAFIAGISAGLVFLIMGKVDESNLAILLFALTSFAILFSFSPSLRKIKASYPLGQYLLLVFSFIIGLKADFREISEAAPTYFLFTLSVVLICIILHLFLAKIFKVDTDTFIITSTAAIFGPVFIGQIAGVLNNKSLVMSGMLTGLMGYAIGNYLGLLVYNVVSRLLF